MPDSPLFSSRTFSRLGDLAVFNIPFFKQSCRSQANVLLLFEPLPVSRISASALGCSSTIAQLCEEKTCDQASRHGSSCCLMLCALSLRSPGSLWAPARSEHAFLARWSFHCGCNRWQLVCAAPPHFCQPGQLVPGELATDRQTTFLSGQPARHNRNLSEQVRLRHLLLR